MAVDSLVSWIRAFAVDRRSKRRRLAGRICPEPLEVRMLLSASRPVAVDDAYTVDSLVGNDPQFDDDRASTFDVLSNDVTIANASLISSLVITDRPAHGEIGSLESGRVGYFGGREGVDTVDDEDSPVGDGHGSALWGVVDQYGQIRLKVSRYLDIDFDGITEGWGELYPSGKYALFVRLRKGDFEDFQPGVFDFQYRDEVGPGKIGSHIVSGQVPGTMFIAWIDNTVGPTHPDTMMLNAGSFGIPYTPEAGFVGTDVFHYALKYPDGTLSREAAVRVTVRNRLPEVYSGEEETQINVPVAVGLASDRDGTINRFSIEIVSKPSHGTLAINAQQPDEDSPLLIYTPNPNFQGSDTFSYTVRDNRGAISKRGVIKIAVTPLIEVNERPVATDDLVSVALNKSLSINVLANDADSDGTLNTKALTITNQPTHGTAVVRKTVDGTVVFYTPNRNYLGPDEFHYTIKDNDGAVSDAALVTINPPPETYDDAASTMEGTAVVIDVLANDAGSASGSPLAPSTLVVDAAPKRGRVTFRKTADGVKAVYTPLAGTASVLVVDDPSDRDDGNYSLNHLSLREAIKLANADRFTDTFTYTVRDQFGIRSNFSVVTVDVAPKRTKILFSPKLTARRPATIRLAQPGDTADGNTALAITSNISLTGPARGNTLTLVGMGHESDLRLFRVATGGALTLSNLTITRAASDGSGGAMSVEAGATATLTKCVLTDNFAFLQGGAISSFGTVNITDCRLSGNEAEQGGAISSFGTLTISNSSLSNNHAEYGGGLHNGIGQATLGNVTLANNKAYEAGGGIFNGGTLQLTGSRFTGNRAKNGGGFFTVREVTLADSTVSKNTADTGGGFEVGSGMAIRADGETAGTVTLTRSLISDNRARHGGGFRNVGRVVASESTFANNHAQQGGAFYNSDFGIQQQGSLVTFTSCTISKNTADQGGGVYVDQGSIALNNTTIGSNSALLGGGLYLAFGGGTLLATTVSNNSASQGGGIYLESGRTTLTSSIVAGNRICGCTSDIAGLTAINAAASFNNLIGSGGSGGLQNGKQGNIVGVNPLLGRLANYGGRVETFPLLPGSPAINAGTSSTVDARGVAAVGQRDIGAFESRGFILTVKAGSGQSTRLSKRFAKPVQVLVSAVNSAEPVVGGVVTFSSPVNGPTAVLNSSHVAIGSKRLASVTAKAGGNGGTYRISATAAGAKTPAMFALTNTGKQRAGQALPLSTTSPTKTTKPPVAPVTSTTVPASRLDWSAGYAVMPTDRTEYALNNRHQLLRRVPAGRWEVLENGVLSFQQTPNGDLYLLNDKRELKRLQLGYSWSIVQSGVQSFQIDAFGTVFVRDNLNYVTVHSAFDRYFVLPALVEGTPHFALDSPYSFEPVHAMGMDTKWGGGQGRWELPGSFLLNDVQYFPTGPAFPLTKELQALLKDSGKTVPDSFPGWSDLPARKFDTSYYNNVRIDAYPILDRIDAPRFFPGVGWAQLHHAQYKVTIYSDTLLANATTHGRPGFPLQVDRIFISHDHLHVCEPQLNSISSAGVMTQPASVAESVSSIPFMSDVLAGRKKNSMVESQGAQNSGRMITAPDGTIYKPGHGQSDVPMIGNEAAPYFLWKLPPNGLWKPLDFVMAHAVGTDSRLYVLDTNHALKTPALGPSKWATLAKDVRSFVVDNDGNLIVLGAKGDLRTLNAKTKQWSATEPRVSSLMISPLGKVYTVTNGKALRALTAAGRWTVIDRGVRDFGMVDDGTIYELNGRGQLVRVSPNGRSRVLASGIQSLQVAPDGGVYVLNVKRELMKLTAREHWTVLDTGVRTFQIAANGDLYLINTRDELRRQKIGHVWSTLQSDVASFTIYSDGTIYAYDRQQVPTLYASLGRIVVLGSGSLGLSEPPTESKIRRAANLPRFIDEYQSPENDNENNFEVPFRSSQPSVNSYRDSDTDPLPLILAPLSDHASPRLRYGKMQYANPRLTAASEIAIQTDLIFNRIEPARFVPGFGPAQLHRAQFKSTITWTADDGKKNTRVIYIDHDRFHFVW